jgi:hypothetical protein
LRLRDLLADSEAFTSVPSPVYGEANVTIAYRCVDLLWRPVGRLVRFVLVRHPVRGTLMLLSTDITMDPLDVIILCGYRFKIELGFRQALHVVGTYAYHFWMMAMTPIRRVTGNQYMHHKSELYRLRVRRKLAAYHRYVQLGCIAQGLLQYLALSCPSTVWQLFRSWLRTMHRDRPPPSSSSLTPCAPACPNFSPPTPQTPSSRNSCAVNSSSRTTKLGNAPPHDDTVRTWHCPVSISPYFILGKVPEDDGGAMGLVIAL